MAECVVEYQNSELDEELTFEVSKNLIITTKVKYKRGDIIGSLVKELDYLRKELDLIKKFHNVLVSEETLIKEWDNEDDAKWDKV